LASTSGKFRSLGLPQSVGSNRVSAKGQLRDDARGERSGAVWGFAGARVQSRLVGLAVFGMLAASLASAASLLPPLGTLLVAPLEARFAAADRSLADEQYDGIIALGGDPERTFEAVRLAWRWPTAKLVIAGQGEERLHDYALAQGIAPERLVIEPHSRNTFENAAYSARLLKPDPQSRWLLVTSPSHLPRAIGSFRKAGFDVTPWAVTTVPEVYRHTTQAAQHEWIGLLAYRVLGRTDALFPGPVGKPEPKSAAAAKNAAAAPG
jgi:uncharacterized SAM-binding protein YcdF (DUF218 family)